MNLKRFFPFACMFLVVAFVLTACGPTTTPTVQEPAAPADTAVPATVAPVQEEPIKIGLFLPDKKTMRYDTKDRPYFEAKLKELCPNCELIYSNVDADATAQLSAVQAAIVNGVKVIVLMAVDSNAVAVAVDAAEAAGIPVVAYSRPIYNSTGVTVQIQVSLAEIGIAQAKALVEDMTAKGIAKPNIIMINGGPADGNMAIIKEGAMSVFQPLVDAGKLTILESVDTPDWDPTKAQEEMTQLLTAYAGTTIDGIYVMNDGMAGGVIAALNAAGIDPMPPVTGLDADLAALQRILSGQQLESVYMPIQAVADLAAEIAYSLATTGEVPAALISGTFDNKAKQVPAVTIPVVSVNATNMMETVIAEGFWTVDQICTADFKAACVAAGLIK